MKITVIGTGYVGLVSGACFADSGNTVLCLDLDARKIDMLNSGGIPIHEPGLETVVQRNHAAGRLIFSTSYDKAIDHGDVIFIAVGTPPDEDGSADLSHVLAAARSIGERITRPVVVVDKSTVPVGTADAVRATIADELRKRELNIAFHVVSNPEFLKEGAAVDDFMRPDRIIVGSDDPSATSVMRQLYKPFNRNHDRLIEMDVRSAELTKYAANAMLATRISFMNELANVAEALGADIEAVRYGIGSDPRIGPHFLYAGVGYGGSCFPKDVKALVKIANDNGKSLRVLEAVEAANDLQKNVLFSKICRHFGGAERLKGTTIALWGLSFKPNTDDMREAPSLVLIRQLLAAGCRIQAYDPVAISEAQRILLKEFGEQQCSEMLKFADSPWDAVQGAAVLALVTEWREFRAPDLHRLAALLSQKAVFDGRNLYDRKDVEAAGLAYYGIGR
ncbi:UDP-glucose/GDP-mannose dehydrogenase family protein [Oxalobacteraceae bacterium R-40]|uniref:UDP-glucose 6-dehydrogenase n=1 Tax=Keguizhuia sedimenti TaxID=3064264 RepID=A0ABU1BPL0_9BURK|nr:UDP-glucose/GDP-mannose dehydrogenase family protein [Oxalobacteraceae bacterium R-40]